jgi:hypothetical protein
VQHVCRVDESISRFGACSGGVRKHCRSAAAEFLDRETPTEGVAVSGEGGFGDSEVSHGKFLLRLMRRRLADGNTPHGAAERSREGRGINGGTRVRGEPFIRKHRP